MVDHLRTGGARVGLRGSLARGGLAILVLAPALAAAYAFTAFDYIIVLNAEYTLVVEAERSHSLCVGDASGGSVVVSDVKEYAVAGQFIVGKSGDGWFVVDMRRSPCLLGLGPAQEALERRPWLPPHLVFGVREKRRWDRTLAALGIATPVAMTKPSRWQATIGLPTWIAWGTVIAIWFPWYLRVRRRAGEKEPSGFDVVTPPRESSVREGPTAS